MSWKGPTDFRCCGGSIHLQGSSLSGSPFHPKNTKGHRALLANLPAKHYTRPELRGFEINIVEAGLRKNRHGGSSGSSSIKPWVSGSNATKNAAISAYGTVQGQVRRVRRQEQREDACSDTASKASPRRQDPQHALRQMQRKEDSAANT